MGSSPKIADLRRLLAERFPAAAPRPDASGVHVAIDAIDAAGGLPRGAVSEIVAAAPSCGTSLFIGCVLAATRAQNIRAALIDATDSFDPASHEPALLEHLVWVRCTDIKSAVAATDLMVRDGNLGAVLLDVRHVALRELRSIPATSWFRLQRAVEGTDMSFIVVTPAPLSTAARFRCELRHSLNLESFDLERATIARSLPGEVTRARGSANLRTG